jgi:hypothetical protein
MMPHIQTKHHRHRCKYVQNHQHFLGRQLFFLRNYDVFFLSSTTEAAAAAAVAQFLEHTVSQESYFARHPQINENLEMARVLNNKKN